MITDIRIVKMVHHQMTCSKGHIPTDYNSGLRPSTTRPSVTTVSRDWGSIKKKIAYWLHLRGKSPPIDPDSHSKKILELKEFPSPSSLHADPSMMAFFFLYSSPTWHDLASGIWTSYVDCWTNLTWLWSGLSYILINRKSQWLSCAQEKEVHSLQGASLYKKPSFWMPRL